MLKLQLSCKGIWWIPKTIVLRLMQNDGWPVGDGKGMVLNLNEVVSVYVFLTYDRTVIPPIFIVLSHSPTTTPWWFGCLVDVEWLQEKIREVGSQFFCKASPSLHPAPILSDLWWKVPVGCPLLSHLLSHKYDIHCTLFASLPLRLPSCN